MIQGMHKLPSRLLGRLQDDVGLVINDQNLLSGFFVDFSKPSFLLDVPFCQSESFWTPFLGGEGQLILSQLAINDTAIFFAKFEI